MAERGAPIGNTNAAKGRKWHAAINRALDRRSKADGIAELDRLAELFLDTIEDMTQATPTRGPSIAGLVDLADRLDGKAIQQIDATVDANLTVEIVRFSENAK